MTRVIRTDGKPLESDMEESHASRQDRIIEKTVATGIFSRTTSRAPGPKSQKELMVEFARRVNEDAIDALLPLEQHAVSLVRRHGSAVVRTPEGYRVVSGDARSVAILLDSLGDRALGPIPSPPGEKRAVTDPMFEDAKNVLGEMMAIRIALGNGHTQSLIKAAVRLGQAATRLRVRPYEDDARVGREHAESQRRRAESRHKGVDDKRMARVAAFERRQRTSATTNDAMRQAAEDCRCSLSTIRNALVAARKLPRKTSKRGRPRTTEFR